MLKEKELSQTIKKKKIARKNKMTLFNISVISIVLIGAVIMAAFVFFKVEFIEANGTSKYASQELVNASGIDKGDNLVFMNTDAIEKKIYLQFPYVEDVEVVKILPSTIKLNIKEAVAYYSVAYEDGYVLVSAKGKLLEIVDEPKLGTAHIKAGEIYDENGQMKFVDEDTQEYLVAIMSAISTRKEGEITEIDLSDIYRIIIMYDDRIEIQLGSPTDLEYKLKFAFEIIESESVGEYDEGTLDVSFGREINKAFLNVKENKPEGEIIPDIDDNTNNSQNGNTSEEPNIDSDRGNDIPDV